MYNIPKGRKSPVYYVYKFSGKTGSEKGVKIHF
jgi:hypothetical protein